MDKKQRERGDNWSTEEKEIFVEIMKESTFIIEDKRTDTNTNKRKIAEWKKVQNKLKELTGKQREVAQMKGLWRRMKMSAKKSVSVHRRALRGTGGGPKPPSPTEEVETIMLMCPTDFIEEVNEFDSDGMFQKVDETQNIRKKEETVVMTSDVSLTEDGITTLLDFEEDIEMGESPIVIEDTVIEDINNANNDIMTKRTALSSKENFNHHVPAKKIKTKLNPTNTKKRQAGSTHKSILLDSNVEFKEKTFKLIEEEHTLKIKYQKQELLHQELRHKLEMDILLLEKEKKVIELNILRKNDN